MLQGPLKHIQLHSILFLQILEDLLPKGMIIPSAFETVGHIAHLNLRDEHIPYKKLIAKVLDFVIELSLSFIKCSIDPPVLVDNIYLSFTGGSG